MKIKLTVSKPLILEEKRRFKNAQRTIQAEYFAAMFLI